MIQPMSIITILMSSQSCAVATKLQECTDMESLSPTRRLGMYGIKLLLIAAAFTTLVPRPQ